MFRKLLAALGAGSAASRTSQSAQPYPEGSAANEIYGRLFCDDLSAFRPGAAEEPSDWQVLLFGPTQDPDKVAELAQDTAKESRIRALAFNWLRGHGCATPKGVVLGVIVEVPLAGGLDVLAAYADGCIRYINQTGKMAFIEPDGLPGANEQAKQLIDLARPVVARIGAWDKERLPPPTGQSIRVSFVVSDGLYFGQGPRKDMQLDALAGPLIEQGSRLLALVTEKALASQGR